jgi:hypothetical protein
VQGREDQVAGFGGGDRGAGRLQVAHFADQDHVRVLTQCVPQAAREVGHVAAHFALLDGALVGDEGVFDRVFERDDVPVLAAVDRVHHRGQRRRLARAGRPGDDDQPAGQVGQLVADLREEELLERADLVVNGTEGQRDRVPLEVGVHAEPPDAGDLVGEVGVAELFEVGPALLRQDFLEEPHRTLWGDDGEIAGLDDGVNAEKGWGPDVNVNVGRLVLNRRTQDVIYQAHRRCSPDRGSRSITFSHFC